MPPTSLGGAVDILDRSFRSGRRAHGQLAAHAASAVQMI